MKYAPLFYFILLLACFSIGNAQNSLEVEVVSPLDAADLPFHECEVRVNNTSESSGVFIRKINFGPQLYDDKRYMQPNEGRWHKEGQTYFVDRRQGSIIDYDTLYAVFIPPGGSWTFQRHLELHTSIRCDVEWQEMSEQYFCSNILVENPCPPDRIQPIVIKKGEEGPQGNTASAGPVSCRISTHNVYSPYCTVKYEDKTPSVLNAVLVKDANEFPICSDSLFLELDIDGNYSGEDCDDKPNNKSYDSYNEKFSCKRFDICRPENRLFQLYPDVFISYLPNDKGTEALIIQVDSNGKPKKVLRNNISYDAILYIQKTQEKGFRLTLNAEYGDLFEIPYRYNIVSISSSLAFMRLMTRAEELGSVLRFSRWSCKWYGLGMNTPRKK